MAVDLASSTEFLNKVGVRTYQSLQMDVFTAVKEVELKVSEP